MTNYRIDNFWRLFAAIVLGLILFGGCQLVDRGEEFDEEAYGETGQSLRRGASDGQQWGYNTKSQQIEENLGF